MEDTRTLVPADLPELLALCSAAGWNQTPADWRRIMALEPEGCLGLEHDGRLVATATTVCYARELAWIGMVLTHADYRGRGFGSRITALAVEHARGCGVRTVKLDATDMGRPVYLRLGFEDECPIERWIRAPDARPIGPTATEPARVSYSPEPALDREAFGADRGALLASLAREEALSDSGQGYALARAGARSLHIGPCVARTPEAARSLLGALARRHEGTAISLDLLPSNAQAVTLASQLGFAPARRLTRMVLRGNDLAAAFRHDDSLVYATAGFEYG
jgi:GNAT superfamily N-acetyltransferase